jgi:hypothetical protein
MIHNIINNNIILIIFLIFLIFYFIYFNKKENFDQRIDGATREQCGIMCTKILDCKSFAHDENKKYCYLSRDDILFNPQKKAFANYYNKNFPRCNKIYKINDPYYNSRDNILRNATYQCMEKEGAPVEYRIYDNKEKRKINFEKLNLEEVAPYTFEKIDWSSAVPSSTGYYSNALGLIVPRPKEQTRPDRTDRFLTNGTSETIEQTPDERNNNRFSGTRPIYDPINDATPGVSIKDPGTINLDENLHLVTNPTKANSINIMKEYDEEFIGQYLFPHKCSTNISKEQCMKQCLDDKNCVGTEWNPILFIKKGEPNKYEFEENVCCPKLKIKKVIKRRSPNRHGHFYLKENVNRKHLQEGEILVGMNKDKKEFVYNDLEENFAKWKNNMF